MNRVKNYLADFVVLFVDDEDGVREAFEELLGMWCKKAYSASNGKEGLEAYTKYKPDIIITDIKMPVMSGLEMTGEIKKLNPDFPIIITTAFAEPEFLLEAIELHVDGYIVKPIQKKELKKRIEAIAKVLLLEKELDELHASLEQRIHDALIDLHQKDEIIIMQSRQAVMGEMISMIAHQWRQPISSISMMANNILADIAFDNVDLIELEKMAKQINISTQELSKKIDDFRNFFKPDTDKELAKINTILKDTIVIIGKSLENNNITIKINEQKEVKEIYTYPRELMQVFMNIINNAKDIFLERKTVNPMIIISCEQSNDENIIITICDNGGGINESIIYKIFEPYFSTKYEKNGTGIGLFMSKMIIEKHLFGEINVYNQDDGACFKIELPYNIKGIK